MTVLRATVSSALAAPLLAISLYAPAIMAEITAPESSAVQVLKDWGSAGAVIFVAWMSLRHIANQEERRAKSDEANRQEAFRAAIRTSEALDRFTLVIAELKGSFLTHSHNLDAQAVLINGLREMLLDLRRWEEKETRHDPSAR